MEYHNHFFFLLTLTWYINKYNKRGNYNGRWCGINTTKSTEKDREEITTDLCWSMAGGKYIYKLLNNFFFFNIQLIKTIIIIIIIIINKWCF